MSRLVASIAMLLSSGCGSTEAAAVPDASTDAADAASEARPIPDAAPDGPRAYCWEMCGAISGLDAAPPDAWVIECAPGQICGETGGAAGWRCCPATEAECMPGTQHGYGCP